MQHRPAGGEGPALPSAPRPCCPPISPAPRQYFPLGRSAGPFLRSRAGNAAPGRCPAARCVPLPRLGGDLASDWVGRASGSPAPPLGSPAPRSRSSSALPARPRRRPPAPLRAAPLRPARPQPPPPSHHAASRGAPRGRPAPRPAGGGLLAE